MQADQFRPERMLDGKFEALPVSPPAHGVSHRQWLHGSNLVVFKPNAWQPFGFGMRGCIVSRPAEKYSPLLRY